MIDGRANFPFSSKFFFLFRDFQRQNLVLLVGLLPMTEVWMHMWGEMMLKRGMPDFLARISREALQLYPMRQIMCS
jgi:hypothetical protein